MRATSISPAEFISKLPKVPQWLFRTLPAELRRKGIDRVLMHYLRRFGIPEQATREVLYYGRIGSHLPAYIERRHTGSACELKIPRETGWLKAPAGYFDGVDALVRHCDAVFNRMRDEFERTWQPPFAMVIKFDVGEDGRPLVVTPSDLKPVVDFCAQPTIFDLVSDYLGQAPVLVNVSLAYTGVNADKIGSQQFHRDMGHDQIHMVIPIWPIDDETGPFTLLPADESAHVVESLHHTGGRVSDESMFGLVSPSKLVRLTGEPGTIYFANPMRCFHYGARSYKKPRLMLIVNMASRFDVGSDTAVYRCSNKSLLSNGSEQARLLLDL